MDEQNNLSGAEHDSSTRSRSAKMLQAASPYLDSSTKQTLEVVVRITDFMEIMQTIQRQGPMNYLNNLLHPLSQNVSTANLKQTGSAFDMENVFKSIRPFCNQQESSFIDRILNVFNIRKYMQMYQTMQSMMSNMNSSNGDSKSETSPFGQNAPDFATLQKMAQTFSAMNGTNSPSFSDAMNMMNSSNFSSAMNSKGNDSTASDYNDNMDYDDKMASDYDSTASDYNDSSDTYLSDDDSDGLSFYDFDTDTPLTPWTEDTEYTPQLKAAQHTTSDSAPLLKAAQHKTSDTDTQPKAAQHKTPDTSTQPKAAQHKTPDTSTQQRTTQINGNRSQSLREHSQTHSQQVHKNVDNTQKNQQMLDLLSTMIPPDQKNTFDAMKLLVESGVLNTK